MNKADTAFILAAAGLVLLMTPGLALFYGGMVRRKNVLGTIMQSLILISVISIEGVYLGYSMSFGPDVGGYGGIAGTICLGLFASTSVNPGGVDGLFFGNGSQLWKQLLGIGVVVVYTFIISWILFKVIPSVMGMRLADDAEVEGMDSTEHSETAYNN